MLKRSKLLVFFFDLWLRKKEEGLDWIRHKRFDTERHGEFHRDTRRFYSPLVKRGRVDRGL